MTLEKNANKKSYIKYFSALLIFGTNGVVNSAISLSSTEIVFWRTLLGSIFLIAAFLLTRNKFTFYQKPKHFLYVVISGIAMGCCWMFLHEAYRQIGVGVATLEYYLGPVIVMILSPILFKEHLTLQKISGFMAVLLGMYLVNGNVSLHNSNLWGLLCGLMSGVVLSVMLTFNKKATTITGFENAVIETVVSFLTVAVFLLLKYGTVSPVSSSDCIYILILGLFNTGVGCYFYFSSFDFIPIQTVAVCGYLEPLAAVIFSVLLLHEPMTAFQGLGAALIIGGAVFCELNPGTKSNKTDILEI